MARLNLSFYGIRDAAQNWTAKYTSHLSELGYVTGRASPCNFRHVSRELFVTVHGDDFTITGPEAELQWMKAEMAAKYEIKTKFLWPSTPCEQKIRVLNRTLRWTAEGVEHEADQRHAEYIT